MSNLEGFKRDYIVFKHDEYDKVSTPTEMNHVVNISHKIGKYREQIGKKSNNEYLVINTDEPYAEEVIEIMKRHGHWG